jgi:hypothetical protein
MFVLPLPFSPIRALMPGENRISELLWFLN